MRCMPLQSTLWHELPGTMYFKCLSLVRIAQYPSQLLTSSNRLRHPLSEGRVILFQPKPPATGSQNLFYIWDSSSLCQLPLPPWKHSNNFPSHLGNAPYGTSRKELALLEHDARFFHTSSKEMQMNALLSWNPVAMVQRGQKENLCFETLKCFLPCSRLYLQPGQWSLWPTTRALSPIQTSFWVLTFGLCINLMDFC